jgi:hypothetical protein
MSEQLMILVAAPYRSGTNDDPVPMVATGQKRGKHIFRDLSEIPERLRQAKR